MWAAVIHVPCEPSSRPGANIRKKFGWKLSHFTLRTLEIFAERVSPATSNCSSSPILSFSSSMYSRRHRDQRLAELLRREPVPVRDLVVAAELFGPGDVLVAGRRTARRDRVANFDARRSAVPLMCVMRARTIGSARARSAPRSSRNFSKFSCSSGGMLMKKKLGVSAGRLRRQSLSRSLRTTASSSSIMMPCANAVSCTTLSVRRRPRFAIP